MKISFKTKPLFIIFDIAIVVVACFISLLLKTHLLIHAFEPEYYQQFILFLFSWVVISSLAKKYRFGKEDTLRYILRSIIISNFLILSILSISIFFFNFESISRFIVISTIAIGTLIEFVSVIIYFSILQSPFLQDWIGTDGMNGLHNGEKINGSRNGHNHSKPGDVLDKYSNVERNYKGLQKAIIEETNMEVYQWITSMVDIFSHQTIVIATTTRFNVDNLSDYYYNTIVNLTRINDIQRINKFFESINAKIPVGGTFIGCGETYQLRKEKILGKYPKGLNYFVYSVDFFFQRVCPKLKITRKIYFLFSRGKNRVISRTETLGRLYSCGFEMVEEKKIGDLLFWMVKKTKQPSFDYNPTYGVLIRLRRIGKNGKEFNVYKLRTMHAYSEYVQHYVYQNNQLDDGGKFKDDFRVTTLGRFLRKIWLDELPMIWNVVKGQLKLVGVRPLSKHYLSLYEPEIRNHRLKHKPGLIPPYYAQYPPPISIEDVQKNEREYLLAYEKHPLKTDTVYFLKAIYNIFVKRARSK
jgi:lipopolysaccharide/colanic/teichoic acid biosynthesis glycosyltransferase